MRRGQTATFVNPRKGQGTEGHPCQCVWELKWQGTQEQLEAQGLERPQCFAHSGPHEDPPSLF